MDKKNIIILLAILLLSSFFGGCVTTRHSLVYDGITRYYDIHIPPSYTHESSAPLVICLHYGGGNGELIEEVTMLSKKADIEGFIVVYPYGTGLFNKKLLTWNAGFTAGYALEHHIDDVGFIRALIQRLQGTLNINSSRIYITGFCNGAAMTYRLGAELSDIVAAIAPVAGSIGGKTTEESMLWVIPDPKEPMPVIVFHGLLDTFVPYDGGLTQGNGTYSILSVNESIRFWVEHNTCDKIPVKNTSESGNIMIDYYKNNKTNADVVLYTIANEGHAWPGGNSFVGGDEPTTEISATDIIWDFFKHHPKQDTRIRVEYIDPLHTDPMMTPLTDLPDSINRNLDHLIAVPKTLSTDGVLYVHLPGSGGLPEDYQLITKHAAKLGYHVINLAYPNWPAVRTLIQDQTDPQLPEQIRRERLFGENQTNLIKVTPVDCIENRIVRLLEYNSLQYPDEQWDQFLYENHTLRWDRIVVGGHSQGAGHATYLAKLYKLRGIILFAGPGDYVKDYGSAPWLFKENMISSEDMYGFTHRLDPVSRLFFNHQSLLGMDVFGSPQRVDGKTSDELQSHILTSWILDIPESNFHNAVAVDDYIPSAWDTPIYEQVWTYMFSELLVN